MNNDNNPADADFTDSYNKYLTEQFIRLETMLEFLEYHKVKDELAQFLKSGKDQMWFYRTENLRGAYYNRENIKSSLDHGTFIMYRFYMDKLDTIMYEEYWITKHDWTTEFDLDYLFADIKAAGYNIEDDDIGPLPAIFRSGYKWPRGPEARTRDWMPTQSAKVY